MTYALRLALVALAYFATGKAGLAMPYVGSTITLLWPPTGIALASLLRLGPQYAPAVWLAACAVNATTGVSIWPVLCIATGNTLGPLLGQQLLSRLGDLHPAMDRTRDVWWLLGVGAAFAMLVPASVGIAALVTFDVIPASSALSAWLVWWLGDALGVMMVAPPLLTYQPRALTQLLAKHGRSVAASGVLTLGLSALAFLWAPGSREVQAAVAYLSMVFVIWAGLRWGMFGGTSLALLLSAVAGVGTALGKGPFALQDTYLGLNLLWSFIALTTLASLLTLALQLERDRATSDLRESERRLATTLAYLPGLVYRRRHEGPWVPTFLSEKSWLLTGFAPEQLLADRPAYDTLIDVADRSRIADEVRGAVQAGRPFELQYRIRTANGKERWCLEYGDALRDEAGRAIELDGIVFDNTERKQIEHALLHAQRMEAVGQLAGGIAHDFNNLLMVIVGCTELIQAKSAATDPNRKHAAEILTAANRGADLVKQLLAYSRKQALQPQEIAVSDLVSELQRMLSRLIGPEVTVVHQLESRSWVRADPSQLNQVVMNLVLNASDAMPNGGQLHVATEDVEVSQQKPRLPDEPVPGRYVVLTVRDTGTGMPSDVRDRIFEPFFTTKEVGKGTGLGLATAYGIVQQSGGYLTVESEPGRGATFRVYLPRVDVTAA